MFKCELKPWKIGEPQIVGYEEKSGIRIVVEFSPFIDEYEKVHGTGNISFEISQGTDCMGVKTWTYFAIDGWVRDLIADCLGIPEIIE